MTDLEKRAERDENLRNAFLTAFSGVAGERVLAYLADFCREEEDGFVERSERMGCYLQGRRSVVLEIRKKLKGTTQ